MSTLSRPIFGALAQNFWTTARGASLALAAAVFPDMDGVANRADSFDSRVPAEDVEYLERAFRHACRQFEEHCAGVL